VAANHAQLDLFGSRPKISPRADAKESSGNTLYVATNLAVIERDEKIDASAEVRIDTFCYRKLDTEYYAWLRYRMSLAKQAVQTGRLNPTAFAELRCRFDRVHDWAIRHLGEAPLRAAVAAFKPDGYPPPGARSKPVTSPMSSPTWPTDGDWRFTHPVPQSAVDKVNAVRDQAMALGWSEAALYQNRGRFGFPCGQHYGLVCFVDRDRQIGEVTRRSIEIIGPAPRRSVLRFYNKDVDHPWMPLASPSSAVSPQ
jgi:hypothetical protein